jgi:hypothetical protein
VAISGRPRLFRFKDPATVDAANGLFVVLNPLRDRQPERAADAFLRAMQSGRCEQLLGFYDAHSREDICGRERVYPITGWKLLDRSDTGDQVRLFYLTFRPMPANTFVTLVRTTGGWRVQSYLCDY